MIQTQSNNFKLGFFFVKGKKQTKTKTKTKLQKPMFSFTLPFIKEWFHLSWIKFWLQVQDNQVFYHHYVICEVFSILIIGQAMKGKWKSFTWIWLILSLIVFALCCVWKCYAIRLSCFTVCLYFISSSFSMPWLLVWLTSVSISGSCLLHPLLVCVHLIVSPSSVSYHSP